MLFRDTTWKGARIQEGSKWRNSVALYQVVHEGPYHKLSRAFFFTGRMLCGEHTQGIPADYIRVSRDRLDQWPLDQWPLCDECAAHKRF
jgi:hypothetical protein